MKGNSQSKEVLNNLRGKGKDFENYETKQLIIKITIVYFSKTSSNSDKLIKRWDIMSVIFGSFQSDLDWPPPKRTSQRKASWREVWWTLHAVEIHQTFLVRISDLKRLKHWSKHSGPFSFSKWIARRLDVAKLNFTNSGNQRWYDIVITWLLKGQTIVSRYNKMSAWHHSFPSSFTKFSFVYKTVNDERQKLKLWTARNVLLY